MSKIAKIIWSLSFFGAVGVVADNLITYFLLSLSKSPLYQVYEANPLASKGMEVLGVGNYLLVNAAICLLTICIFNDLAIRYSKESGKFSTWLSLPLFVANTRWIAVVNNLMVANTINSL